MAKANYQSGSPRLPPNVIIRDSSDAGISPSPGLNSIGACHQNPSVYGGPFEIMENVQGIDPRPSTAMEYQPPATRVTTPLSAPISLPVSLAPVSQRQSLLRDTMDLLASGSNAVDFIRPSAPILDNRIAKLWVPLLDQLPIIALQHNVREYCELKPCLLSYLLYLFPS